MHAINTWAIMVAAALPLCATADDTSNSPSNLATAHELPQITVIGNAPLPGLGLPLNQVPASVQTADSADMRRQHTLDMEDYIVNNFNGISISESQGNPFQMDINYHGFTASPLLGTPEGLSIYVDGVRVNESFGDTVNWDLIPESAISTVSLISGSNPVFGLNSLGGALAVQTKSGHNNPGTDFEGSGGSFGRRAFQADTGGEVGQFDYFITGNYFDENGWRDLSPTHLWQAFAKVGWQNDKTDVDVSYTWADTSMTGNGTTPQSMLDYRYPSIYSAPDFTHNTLNFVNATLTQFLAEHLLLTANVYYRQVITNGDNGDVNSDNYLSGDYGGPPIDCAAPPTSLADNAYCANGINRQSTLTQRTTGIGLQLTESHDVFGWKNQGILGANFDHSKDRYAQAFQYATLTPDRTAISNINPYNPAETVNSLEGTNQILGVYITDTLSPNSLLHFTVSARYNRNNETLSGYSIDTGVGDFGDGFNSPLPLSGNHTFSHLNPAFGMTVTPSDRLTIYGNYSQASRAPSVIELGCSNPDQPCGLPNAFASDPNLSQVVAKTVELGIRGDTGNQLIYWNADVFHTQSSNDIQFVATSISEGYFANVGSTRRQGLDFSVGGKFSGLTWRLAYSFVDATYQSSFLINAGSNSTADADGHIVVQPGDRIPLIPRHTGRLILDYAITTSWDIGANLIVSSGAYLHGDENNANQVGGTNGEGAYVIGTGQIGGYSVVNMQSTYHFGKVVDVFFRLTNVLDHKYATAGFLTSNPFNPNGSYRFNPDDWTNENAVSPAQPRAIWAGVQLHWE